MQCLRIISVIALFFSFPLWSLQKVVLLPIINIENDANFAYLEASISDSLGTRLREKLAFDELPEEKWALVAGEHFVLRKDLYTQTAAMNLGIFSKQDIVIAGGYKPIIAKGKAQGKSKIHVNVFLLEVKSKKVITNLDFDLPADSELFTAIGQVADKMEVEARKIIPSKEDAARMGASSATPFFNDFSVGIGAGGSYYVNGYAKYFTPQLPLLNVSLEARLPRIMASLKGFADFIFMSHVLKDGNDTVLQSLGTTTTTTNYILSLGLGYEFLLGTKFILEPFIAAGYVLQSTKVTGSGIDASLFNNFPCARVGVSAIYRINTMLDASFALELPVYMESGFLTLAPLVRAGVIYKL
ncbi:MAG: hypothetical protein LDLANPLL_01185 [Turneriella sp.]|nr:hypothetical protein [Turneriella sp.]